MICQNQEECRTGCISTMEMVILYSLLMHYPKMVLIHLQLPQKILIWMVMLISSLAAGAYPEIMARRRPVMCTEIMAKQYSKMQQMQLLLTSNLQVWSLAY